MTYTKKQQAFLDLIAEVYGNIETITRDQITELVTEHGVKWPQWLTKNHRAGRGIYTVPMSNAKVKAKVKPSVKMPENDANVAVMNLEHDIKSAKMDLVPKIEKGYVRFGHYVDVFSIIKSRRFYPVFITGLSGNGKTFMVEQACAQAKREMFRVNITVETDEDDLLGGFRLVDGATVWHNGPVVAAMERGAVLLLDEVDLASNKIMCLQPVLEGKPVFLKKINRLVSPAPGFTVVATANTKGRGSDDGKFIGTNVLNEAFLERFSITMEQEYPPIAMEKKILNNILAENDAVDEDFATMLVNWADIIRRSFYDGAVSDVISTRRLVHICEAYGIFDGNRMKAIELCINRFDNETKSAFLDLYSKVDSQVIPPTGNTTSGLTETEKKETVAF
jgi:hypothetical protein